MRSRAAPCLLALACCAPRSLATVIDAPSAPTYLLVSHGPGHVDLRAFDHVPIELDRPDGLDVEVLAYDRTIAELRLSPDADGTIAALPADASPHDAWPLPSPSRAWALAKEAHEFVPGMDGVAGLLDSFRVARPACVAAPRIVPLHPPLPESGFVSAVVPAGSGVLVGVTPEELPMHLFRASPERGIEEELTSMLAETTTSARFALPLSFRDGDQSWLAWPASSSTIGEDRLDLYPVSGAGEIGSPTQTFAPATSVRASFVQMVAGTFGGQRTLVARDDLGGLWLLDEATKRWALKKSLGADHASCPDLNEPSVAFTVDGPGRGVVGAIGGPIVEYDFASPDVLGAAWLPDVPVICASALLRAPSGLEMVVYDQASRVVNAVHGAWRRAGGTWRELDATGTLDAHAIIVIGQELWISGSRESLVRFDDEPSRPEIPPRECGVDALSITIINILGVGERGLFVGGYGQRATFLERALQ